MPGMGRDRVRRQSRRYCMSVASLSEEDAVADGWFLVEDREYGPEPPASPALPLTDCSRRITDTTKLRCCCSSMHSCWGRER